MVDAAPDTQVTRRVVTIPADHPCLPGHFHGRPIVPAVVVLDEVLATIARTCPEQQLAVIDHSKFQDFVLPDQPFKIALTMTEDRADIIDFTCSSTADGRLLAKGRFRLKPADPAV